MSKIFAGRIEEKQELSTYNDKDSVINLIVACTKVIAGTITTEIKRTVVLFKNDAVKADKELKVDDLVLFSEVERSPRTYKNKKQQDVTVLDLRANGFTKMSAKQYKDNKDSLDAMMIQDLDFTEADQKALDKLAEEQANALLDAGTNAAAAAEAMEPELAGATAGVI